MIIHGLKCCLSVLAVTMFLNMNAQEKVRVEGSDYFVIPANMTLEQAEMYAIEKAKLKVIGDNFGTVVASATSVTISNDYDHSLTKTFTFGETEVKGEWLSDLREPEIERKIINNEFVLKVTVAGVIRGKKNIAVPFSARVLRNGTEDNCESDRFRQNDKMYVSFQSSVQGYIAIYMTDGNIVQCLYPYNGMPSEKMAVEQDKRYVFFSKEHTNGLDPNLVNRCVLGCEQDNELNRVYLIFSQNLFSKAVDHTNGNMPRTLSFSEYYKWYSRLRMNDPMLSVKVFDIIISK